jgi:aryl-alcohol dehydrogenase-like predicted oxidoreductase
VLHRPEVAGAIVGIRNEAEARELTAAAELSLSADDLREIEAAAP